MVIPEFGAEVWTAVGIVASLLLSGLIGKAWRPVRRAVTMVDVVSGRPARYPGDPEERPGIAERLDRIDASIAELRDEVETVKQEVQNIEGCTE